MKRSFLFVGAKPARASARRWTATAWRQEHERVGAPSHLVRGARDERPHCVSVVGRSDEIGEEARRDAVLEGVPHDRDAAELLAAVCTEAAVVARRVEVAPGEVRGVAR